MSRGTRPASLSCPNILGERGTRGGKAPLSTAVRAGKDAFFLGDEMIHHHPPKPFGQIGIEALFASDTAGIGGNLFDPRIDACRQSFARLDPGGPVDQCAAFGQQRDQTCIQRVDARAQGGHIGDIVEACHGAITCTA